MTTERTATDAVHEFPDPKNAEAIELVPNLRVLRSRVVARMRRSGHDVMVAPPVFVLARWAENHVVRQRALAGSVIPGRLARAEHLALWEAAVDADPPAHDDSGPFTAAERRHFARQARAADRLLRQWREDDVTPERPGAAWQALARWRRSVDDAASARMRFTDEDWLAALTRALERADILPSELPAHITLVGFREHTLIGHRVIEALSAAGVTVTAEERGDAALAVGVACRDRSEEWRAAARWARKQSAPGRRIGVAVHDIERHWPPIRDAFDAEFFAGDRLVMSGRRDSGYHLATGVPLASHEAVGDAFELVRFALAPANRRWPVEPLSRWLLSPWWQGADIESRARAQLERSLRRIDQYEWSMPSLLKHAERLDLLGALSSLSDCLDAVELARRATPGVAGVEAALRAWGWPGPLARGEETQQVVAAMASALETVSALSPQSSEAAFEAWRHVIDELSVSVRGGDASPVQVTTLEDAAADRFDALWVANLTVDNWPARPDYNPFVPAEWRDELPRGSEDWMLRDAEALTDALTRVAPEVRFSWAESENGVPLGPSPMVAGLEVRTSESAERGLALAVATWGSPDSSSSARPELVRVAEGPAPACQPEELTGGGAGLLSLQAACPFAAFLVHRLGARHDALPSPFPGPAARGEWVHAALDRLYRQALDGGVAPHSGDIPRAVDEALTATGAAYRWSPIVLAAERARLQEWLEAWLEFDAGRHMRVVATEQMADAHLGPLTLAVRLDRVEQSAAGGQVVLDYKTGSPPAQKRWFEERLFAPQVPLYAITLADRSVDGSGETLVGAGIAVVKRGKCAVIGRSVDGVGQLSAVTTGEWQEILSDWRTRLTTLADEFAAGEAAPVIHDDKGLAYAGLELILAPAADAQRGTAR